MKLILKHKDIIFSFIVSNISYFIISILDRDFIAVVSYIICVGIFTEIAYVFKVKGMSYVGYYGGIIIGAKYVGIALLYLGIRFLLENYFGLNLPL